MKKQSIELRLHQKVLIGIGLLAFVFIAQIAWNLMTGAYAQEEVKCPQGYTCERIPELCYTSEAKWAFVVWDEKENIVYSNYRNASSDDSINIRKHKSWYEEYFNNGTRIPRCDEEPAAMIQYAEPIGPQRPTCEVRS